MNFTPFGALTDNELIREVCNKSDPTDLELELMERLTYWLEYAESNCGVRPSPATTKYKEAA